MVLFALFTAALVGLTAQQGMAVGLSRVLVPLSLAIALHLFPLFWNHQPDPFEPASFHGLQGALGLISVVITFIAREKVQISFLPGVAQSTVEDLIETIGWAYVVANASYLIGYYSRLGKRASKILPTRLSTLAWSPQRVLVAILLCLLVATPAYAVFQSRVGGGLLDITQLKAGKEALRDDPASAAIVRAIAVGMLPSMLLVALAAKTRNKSSLLLAVAAVALSAILILRLGQRGIAIFYLATCGAIYHYLRRRIPLWLVAGALFLTIVASNILGEYRLTEDARQREGLTAQRFDPTEALEDLESDRGRMSTMAVIWYTFPERVDYLLGESWYALIAAPIPTWLWTEKREAFRWRETRIMVELRNAPIPVPFVGLLYANFSWLGIVFGMSFWGIAQRALYEWMLAREQDSNTVLLYSNLLIVAAPTVFAISWAILFALPMALVLAFIGLRRTRPAVEGPRRSVALPTPTAEPNPR